MVFEFPEPQGRQLINQPQATPGTDGDADPRGSITRLHGVELFRNSCGGMNSAGDPQYLELTVTEPNGSSLEKTWKFSQPVVLIGRAANCDLRLARREVSRLHAYLQLIDGRWMCVDCGSENGVKWPSGRQRYGWLESAGQISVGPYQIRSVPRSPAFRGSESLPAILRREDCPKVQLEFLNGKCADSTRSSWTVQHRVTMIGASRPCELQLEDPTVAKIHASLVLTARELWIVNLVGDDRTRVDGQPVRWQRLESGNELKIGKFRFRVQYVSYPTDSRPCSFKPRGERPRTESEPLSATGGNGISEAFVLGLMSQMAAMQQQFLEHSQQQMLMTAQLLSSLRTPQHGVDEELARVQELTRELQTLRGQMAGELALRPPPSIPTAPDVTPTAPTISVAGLAAPTPTETAPVLTTTESDLVEKPAEAVTASEDLGMQPQMDSQGAVNVGPPPPPDNPAAEPVELRQRRTYAAVEMHAALIERMANLESERTSRWSKIIGALMGNRQ